MTTKVRSKKSSIENVKRLFSNSPDNDEISLEEAFRSWGRTNPENVEAHKPWLSNVMTHLTYHNLVRSVYSYDEGRRKLKGIALTHEGKRALGRVEGHADHQDISSDNGNGTFSVGNVMKIVASLRKDNPEYEITFDVKLKEDRG